MSLSIVIVNYRSWLFLESCLDSLLSDPDSSSWQIIVVDNDSGDGELSAFRERYPSVDFTAANRNGGFSSGCNVGARQANGDHLLFLNPDVVVRSGQVTQLLNIKQKESKLAVLGARQVNKKGHPQKTWDVFPDMFTNFKLVKSLLRKFMPKRFPDPRKHHQKLVYCDWVTGAVFLVSRKHFDLLGGWSEDYWMYSEDCDFCYMAGQRGLAVASTSEALFIHHHGSASRRDLDTAIHCKSEAIISKHVFNQRHRLGLKRRINHFFIFFANAPELLLWALLDLLTLRQVYSLNVRTGMLAHMLGHYRGVFSSGDWRSSRLKSMPN